MRFSESASGRRRKRWPVGKYDHVIKNLPKLPPEPGPKQDRIDAAKAEFAGMSVKELTQAYLNLRDEADELNARVEKLDERVQATEQLIVEVYEAEGIHSLKMFGGAAVRTDPIPYASVADKQTYRQWCIQQGLEDQMVLPWPTTTSIVKERLLNGDPEPPGVTVFCKTTVVATGRVRRE
jgi:hypothetical protein